MEHLYETPWLGEDIILKALVKTAEIDDNQEGYNPRLAAWFYHLLIEDGVTEEVAKLMKYNSEHICQKDLEKIMTYIQGFPGEEA